jgi:hypothetical protein
VTEDQVQVPAQRRGGSEAAQGTGNKKIPKAAASSRNEKGWKKEERATVAGRRERNPEKYFDPSYGREAAEKARAEGLAAVRVPRREQFDKKEFDKRVRKEPGANSMTRESREALRREIAQFARSLPSEDRQLFWSGKRLSRKTRDELAARVEEPRGEGATRGLRFADEPPAKANEAGRPNIHQLALLMDLWDTGDVLLTELVMDILVHGQNLAYNGSREIGRTVRPPRCPHDPGSPEFDVMVQQADKDVEEGRAAPFREQPPEGFFRAVPIKMVEKPGKEHLDVRDGKRWRMVKNYSWGRGRSVNGQSDKVEQPAGDWEDVVRHFINAGKDAYIVKWDEEGAYAQLKIREADRPLTYFYVPTRGWSYRLAGDFGHATCGYAWDAVGRALVTAFHVMSHRAIISDGGVELRELERPAEKELPKADEKPEGGWARRSGVEVMLSPRGKRMLDRVAVRREEGMVDMRYIARWVDDFIKVTSTEKEADKARSLVLFLHARYGIKLAPDKLEGPQRKADFGGGDFITKGTWLSIPRKKRDKYARDLERMVKGEEVDVRFMDTMVGRMGWCTRFFPKGKPFVKGMRAFKASLETQTAKARARASKFKGFSLPQRKPSGAALTDAEFWLQVMRDAPATFAPLHHQHPADAQVHVHMDWGMGGIKGGKGQSRQQRPNFVGVYVLTTGDYTVIEVPPEWMHDASPASLEALGPVVFGVTFPDIARGRHCVLYSDCEPFVLADNKHGRSNSPTMDKALKVSALLQITLNARFTIMKIPRVANLADALSKQDMKRFREECGRQLQPKASPTKSSLPTPRSFWRRL